VLRLLQARTARQADFQALLEQTVQALESLAEDERERWLDLLSYIQALVYHKRDPAEHGTLEDVIEASVEHDPHRKEVRAMGRTIAQALEAKGRKEGERSALRKTLVRLLTTRFGTLPAGLVETINRTAQVRQLDDWLDRFATAKTLEDVGIDPEG
jgi:hypothetical protein